MKSKTVLLTWTLVCLVPVTSSCGIVPLKSLVPSKSIPETRKVQPNASTLDRLSKNDQVSADSSEFLKEEKFDRLDQLTVAAQTSRERLPGGYWKVNAILEGLRQPNLGQNASEGEWKAHIVRIEKWKALVPTSVAARIALAESWVNFGLNARGTGYVNTISKENRRLFQERVHKGYVELSKCQNISGQWPAWYVAMLEVGRAEGWDRKKYDEMFEAGFRIEPTYYHLHRQMMMYLLPQYFGEKGEIAKFIENNSSRVAGDEGEILYFILFAAMQTAYGHQLNIEVPLSWERAKLGYEALSRSYGVDRYRKNQFAWLAFYGCLHSDMVSAAKSMKEIGDDWDPEVWDSKQEFEMMKNFLAKHPEMIRPSITPNTSTSTSNP
jgi:hypothetical protein